MIYESDMPCPSVVFKYCEYCLSMPRSLGIRVNCIYQVFHNPQYQSFNQVCHWQPWGKTPLSGTHLSLFYLSRALWQDDQLMTVLDCKGIRAWFLSVSLYLLLPSLSSAKTAASECNMEGNHYMCHYFRICNAYFSCIYNFRNF